MLNQTYTSVNNANLINCNKKHKIHSLPTPLLRKKFLGEYRTELDKKKVLANLGIDNIIAENGLALEWIYV